MSSNEHLDMSGSGCDDDPDQPDPDGDFEHECPECEDETRTNRAKANARRGCLEFIIFGTLVVLVVIYVLNVFKCSSNTPNQPPYIVEKQPK